MFRFTTMSLALAGLLIGVNPAKAQVFVRAPFVRVEVGPPGTYTYVRAPFVNLFIPSRGVVYQPTPSFSAPPAPPAPGVFPTPADPGAYRISNAPPQLTPFGPTPANPPPGVVIPPPPAPDLPFPQVVPGTTDAIPPPQPLQSRYPTLPEFAKNFQAKAGSFDVTIINPVTNQPTRVKFTLPEGSPRRVILNQDEIEFRYNLREWVRIEFDKNGAVITSR